MEVMMAVIIKVPTSIKKQLKIARLSRDGRIKSTQTRMVGIIDKMHSYNVFSSNRVSMKNCVGMQLVYYPYHSSLCTTIPT